MRNDGSMMLMQALQRFRPQIPGVDGGDGGVPQANVYRSKGLDQHAMDAWSTALGAHEGRAKMRNAAGMHAGSLANALEERRLMNSGELDLQGLRNQGEMDKLGVTDPTVRRGQDLGLEGVKYNADSQRDWRKDMADAARQRAIAEAQRRSNTTPTGKPFNAKVFGENTDQLTKRMVELQKPETWSQVDPKIKNQLRAEALGALEAVANQVRVAQSNYERAMQRGDVAGQDAAYEQYNRAVESAEVLNARTRAAASGAPARPAEDLPPGVSPDNMLFRR